MVILCNGKFPEHPLPVQVLNRAAEVVCCDGAAVKLLEHGRTPFAIIGDLDSLPADIREKFADRVFHDADQENNDLTKAVHWCVTQGAEEIIILGATGLREDHTIGNVSLLAEYAEYAEVQMITDTGIFVPVIKSASFESHAGQQISIFAITPDTRITTTGLRFNVTDRRFVNWYQGTLNEATGDSFGISFDSGKLVIFSEHDSLIEN